MPFQTPQRDLSVTNSTTGLGLSGSSTELAASNNSFMNDIVYGNERVDPLALLLYRDEDTLVATDTRKHFLDPTLKS